MKSVMDHSFSQAPSVGTPRSVFDMSHGYKTAFDAGYLIPFYVEDVLPGDTFTLNANILARLNTPEFPIMDNLFLDTHFFFVPLRLVWANARKFFGEQVNPADSIDYALPTFASFTPAESSLSDYLGLPPVAAMTPVSLYHRAYNLIWNEWYRDQNLQDSVVVDTDDGPDDIADYVLLRRGKRHDYFTSCLPWPQKGAAVSLPLGTTAPLNVLGAPTFTDVTTESITRTLRFNSTDTTVRWDNLTPGINDNATWQNPNLQVDLSTATAATINDLREAFQVQKLLERDARGGTRYSELLRNHFGVNFYDVSYRPEFLGGGSVPVRINPVANTTNYSVVSSYVGDLGAFGVVNASGHGFTKSFVEHGIVMGFVSVRADLTYQQGIHRRFLKSTRYDIYWPSLAHLGEQAVTNAEIYYQGTAADDDVFGYQERHAEYRYHPSQVTAALRSTAVAPLDAWHLSQEFSSLPILGDTFIQENPPLDRVVRFPTEPHFVLDSYIHCRAARPMPVFSVPGYIDHF